MAVFKRNPFAMSEIGYHSPMAHKRLRFWYLIIKLVLYVAIGVVILAGREHIVGSLKYFIGGMMLLYGVEDILFLALIHRKEFYKEDKTYLGLVELIIGMAMFFAPLAFESVCMIWATWSIMREAVEIKEVLLELKRLIPRILSLVESVVVIIFAILFLFTPSEEHAHFHLTLLTIELILAPLVPFLELVLTKEDTAE